MNWRNGSTHPRGSHQTTVTNRDSSSVVRHCDYTFKLDFENHGSNRGGKVRKNLNRALTENPNAQKNQSKF